MRVWTILFLFIFVACAGQPINRGPASIDTDEFYGEADYSLSNVKLFPPEREGNSYHHFFYVELRNKKGQFVDVDSREIRLRTKTGKGPQFSVSRLLRGRYYIAVDSRDKLSYSDFDFLLQGKLLKEQVKLNFQEVSPRHTWIKSVSKYGHRMKMRLFLGDSRGKAIDFPSPPELILDGNGFIEDLTRVSAGTWEFDLLLPDQNEIVYISLRAHGKYLERLYRLQHIAN